MTELGEMIWDDGVEQGKQMATNRYNRLILLLNKEQKENLIIKAASDPDAPDQIYSI